VQFEVSGLNGGGKGMSQVQLFQTIMEEVKRIVRWDGFDENRVSEAVKHLIASIDVVKLHYLENCVGCGACGPSCPYYYVDEKYSPANKAEETRRIYRKKLTIAGMILGPLVEAKLPRNEKDLDKIVEFAYRCTNCGACYTACPFGIDSGVLVKLMKGFSTVVGRVPTILAFFEAIERLRVYKEIPALMRAWKDVIDQVNKELGRTIELDRKGAKVLYLPTLMDVISYPKAVIATAKLLDKLGLDWTMPSEPIGVRPPIAVVIGLSDKAKTVLRRIYEYIESIGPEMVVLIDGGFVYPLLRFELPSNLNVKPRFRVVHVTELLAESLEKGKLMLKQTEDKVTWHPPCQMTRRGGVTVEPEYVLELVSKDFRKLPHHGLESYCCGGGGGIGCITFELIENMAKMIGVDANLLISGEKEHKFIEETEKAYKVALKRKIDDIKRSGAEIVVTACPTCIRTIMLGARLYGVNVKVLHIMEYLYDKI